MRRGVKIAIGVGILLAVLIAINTAIVDNQTKSAEVTIEGGRILDLPGGSAQVYVEGPGPPRPVDRSGPGGPRPIVAAPIVLIHCYSCSLHWWDRLAPILAEDHRVIRIDLLGHGGSEKPSGGYEIPAQAALVATALDRLNVQGAVVVGHSMGFSVATALAERATQLVDRVVNIDEGPSMDHCSLPFLAKLAYVPVVGQTIWRITPDFAVEDGYGDAFAPGYEISEGFPNPDQVTDDYAAMTFTSFDSAHEANEDFSDELSLDARLRRIPVPLLSIFGTEDQICDPESSQAAYETVPGARIAEVEDAGHSPNVEKPVQTAALIEEFAADAGDDTIKPPPKDIGLDRDRPKRPQAERNGK
jgi:pimeloyl-ACP methyl ester carboxylesterase